MTGWPDATRRRVLGVSAALPALVVGTKAAAKPATPPPPPPELAEAPLVAALQPLARLLGRWTGQGSDQIGFSTVDRTYSSVLNGHGLMVRDIAIYPSQTANQSGEIHTAIGMFGFDAIRRIATLRQFDSDGVVRSYALKGSDLTGDRLEFESDAVENLPPGCKARETYVLLGPDALQHVYEIAPPGGEFAVYTNVRLVRA